MDKPAAEIEVDGQRQSPRASPPAALDLDPLPEPKPAAAGSRPRIRLGGRLHLDRPAASARAPGRAPPAALDLDPLPEPKPAAAGSSGQRQSPRANPASAGPGHPPGAGQPRGARPVDPGPAPRGGLHLDRPAPEPQGEPAGSAGPDPLAKIHGEGFHLDRPAAEIEVDGQRQSPRASPPAALDLDPLPEPKPAAAGSRPRIRLGGRLHLDRPAASARAPGRAPPAALDLDPLPEPKPAAAGSSGQRQSPRANPASAGPGHPPGAGQPRGARPVDPGPAPRGGLHLDRPAPEPQGEPAGSAGPDPLAKIHGEGFHLDRPAAEPQGEPRRQRWTWTPSRSRSPAG